MKIAPMVPHAQNYLFQAHPGTSGFFLEINQRLSPNLPTSKPLPPLSWLRAQHHRQMGAMRRDLGDIRTTTDKLIRLNQGVGRPSVGLACQA